MGKTAQRIKKTVFRQWVVFSWRDTIVTLACLAAATLLGLVMGEAFYDKDNVIVIYFLAVVVVSRLTNGYFYGIMASLASVAAMNFFFTYPYYELNFTIEGYPVTFFSMLIISSIISTLTIQVKKQSVILHEAEKEKMRSNLLRAISHDLRTPLTGILGASSTLLENGKQLDAETRDHLLMSIKEDSQWLIRMVENLLSVTRINGESATVQKKPEAVEEMVGEAIARVRSRYPGQKILVRVPDELLIAEMDATLMEQVILNLVENAVKHGGRPVEITLTVTKEGDRAVFDVADNGRGLNPEEIPTLFQGGLSAQDGHADSTRGMGIGLSICQSIIKAHGGSITAENRPEGGARFCFSIPLEGDGTA